jgi:hypothetical protein
MDLGFRLMDSLDPQLVKQEKFERVFVSRPWKASTVSKNYSAWKRLSPEILSETIAFGRTDRGTWANAKKLVCKVDHKCKRETST